MNITQFLKWLTKTVKTMMTVVIFLMIIISSKVMAGGEVITTDEDLIVPDGGIIIKSADGEEIRVKPVKTTVQYEPLQAQLEAGKLTRVKKTLDVALVEDDEKDEKIRQSLIAKMDEAEHLFNQYLALKENSNGNKTKLQKAKNRLEQANTIWSDNYAFQTEKTEINKLIKLVESGGYEKWHKRNKAEKEIKSLIKEAKFCEADSDCVRVGFGCPFGCGTAVNESMVEQIKSKVDEYNQDQEMICMYDCYIPPSLKPMCVQNRCSLK